MHMRGVAYDRVVAVGQSSRRALTPLSPLGSASKDRSEMSRWIASLGLLSLGGVDGRRTVFGHSLAPALARPSADNGGVEGQMRHAQIEV